jgi:Matrixin
MRRARLAAAGAALAVAAAAIVAAGYVRSTDASTKACLYWASRAVQYRIYPGPSSTVTSHFAPTCAPSGDLQPFLDAVHTATSQWTGAVQSCTDLQLVDAGGTGSAIIGYDRGGANENTIVMRQGWCSVVVPASIEGTPEAPTANSCWSASQLASTCANKYNCFDDTADQGRDTLALTTATYNQDTGEIYDADMELNGWDDVVGALASSGTNNTAKPPDGWYFTCTAPTNTKCNNYGDSGCAYIDVQNTVTHETGHLVGFAHTPDSTSTMYAYSSPLDFAKRTLSPDDVAGLCAVYPAGGPTSTCVQHKGGCASGGEGAGLSVLLAALAPLLARVRRRR